MGTNYRLRTRAIALRSNINDLFAHPAKRGSDDGVSGTILEISSYYDRIADRLAAGDLAMSDLERISVLTGVEEAIVGSDGRITYETLERLCPIPAAERLMAMILLARREVVESKFPLGTSADTQRFVVRIETLADLGDDSDRYVSAILGDIERRVEEWVCGDRLTETTST